MVFYAVECIPHKYCQNDNLRMRFYWHHCDTVAAVQNEIRIRQNICENIGIKTN